MRIYRIEHPERRNGPFSAPLYLHHKVDYGSWEFPGPAQLGWHLVNEVFGCKSTDALANWFGREDVLEILKKHDFHAVVYEAEPVYIDEDSGQVCFPLDGAHKLLSRPLVSLSSYFELEAA